MIRYARIDSPLGDLLACGEAGVLTGLYMVGRSHAPVIAPHWRRDSECFAELRAQLAAYFAGELSCFHLSIRARGTPFQEQVWERLRAIPYGATRSYAELARELGRPKAARAVGLANGKNPISIVVPCHRVIGADGSLTGYAGGIERKAWLLQHEAVRAGDRTES